MSLYAAMNPYYDKDLPSMEKSLEEPWTTFKYGLPTWEVNNVCRQMYKNNVVKVTLQIASPEALQIKRDIRVTFADQLGVVGK